MMRLIVLSALLAIGCAFPFQHDRDEQWKNYKNAFAKVYKGNEESARRLIWEQNLEKIIKHNLDADLGKHSYTMGQNHLTDMTAKEVKQILNGYKSSKKVSNTSSTFLPPFNALYPEEVDWRKDGMVTGVKNQGQCGSCWAFSTTGSLEGQHKKKTGDLVSLSEQNLVDCSTAEGNEGCEGGLMDNAFEYIKENKGIDTEESYPYDAADEQCRFKRSTVGATVTGYVDIPSGDEDALKKAVATIGPISVAIDASQPSFQSYREGVYDEKYCSTTALDHGVLVVGYGTEGGVDYWLVKNSWGAQWGEQGYIKMSRNKNNQCGIATEASYPLV